MTRVGQDSALGDALDPVAINAEVGRQCHQFVFGATGSKAAIDALALASRPPRIRFRTGPGYMKVPGGGDEYLGEVVHMYSD
jgi:hypothetical protein